MAGSTLSELFVEISAKGIAKASDEIRGMTKAVQAASNASSQLAAGINSLTTPLKYLAAGAGIVTASITALAYKGFEGTTQMYLFQRQVTLLGREVASILTPVLNMLTNVVARVVTYFQSLSATGQRAWAIVFLLVAGFTALVGTGLAVIAVITGIIAALIGVAASIVFIMAEIDTATGGLYTGILIIGAVVTALTGIFTAIAGGGALGASAIGAFALTSERLRAAFGGVMDAFGRVWTAAEPMLTRILYLVVLLIEVGLQPMIIALNVIEATLHNIAAVAEYLGRIPFFAKMGQFLDKKLGIGNGEQRSEVTLNQTGNESAAGKFDRIQQEIYRMTGDGRGTPEEETAKNTKGILDYLLGQSGGGGESESTPDRLIRGAGFEGMAAAWAKRQIGGSI